MRAAVSSSALGPPNFVYSYVLSEPCTQFCLVNPVLKSNVLREPCTGTGTQFYLVNPVYLVVLTAVNSVLTTQLNIVNSAVSKLCYSAVLSEPCRYSDVLSEPVILFST